MAIGELRRKYWFCSSFGYPVSVSTGVRLTDYNTAFMAGITIASTWDKGALYTRGYNMGKEFKGKGVNIGLLPVCGPLGKSPEAGR